MSRHTLTLDEDNERLLRDERVGTDKSFETVDNDLLRELRQRRLGNRNRKRKRPFRYELEPFSVGRIRHGVVSVTEALELGEGDGFR